MSHYRIAGLRVASDIPFPGLIDDDDPRVADVAIRAGAVPRVLDAAEAAGPNWAIANDQLILTIPGIVRLSAIGGRELTYELEPGVAIDDAAVFISGTGLGVLLHQRGKVVLHASAVRVGDQAMLFCGPSGAGKSTLAAALVERGYPLVADDICALDIAPDERLHVTPDGRHMKLWEQAIGKLHIEDGRGRPVRPQLRKFHVAPRTASATALPVGAIYVLREDRPPHAPGIATPELAEGAALLQRNAYRPALVARMDQRPAFFRAAAAAARQRGIFTLTRALAFDRFDEVIGWLEAHWRERAAAMPPA